MWSKKMTSQTTFTFFFEGGKKPGIDFEKNNPSKHAKKKKKTCPDFQPDQLHRFIPTCRFVCVKTTIPPRPKPQNLGGLVGGDAEFDPLGFSDTFDVRALASAGGEHGVLQGQNGGLFCWILFEGTTIEDQSVKAFCCTKIDVSATTLNFLEFLRHSDGFIHPRWLAGFLNHQQ